MRFGQTLRFLMLGCVFVVVGCDYGDLVTPATVDVNDVEDPAILLLEWEAQGAIPAADVNHDGTVDILDLIIVARNFGQDVEPVATDVGDLQEFLTSQGSLVREDGLDMWTFGVDGSVVRFRYQQIAGDSYWIFGYSGSYALLAGEDGSISVVCRFDEKATWLNASRQEPDNGPPNDVEPVDEQVSLLVERSGEELRIDGRLFQSSSALLAASEVEQERIQEFRSVLAELGELTHFEPWGPNDVPATAEQWRFSLDGTAWWYLIDPAFDDWGRWILYVVEYDIDIHEDGTYAVACHLLTSARSHWDEDAGRFVGEGKQDIDRTVVKVIEPQDAGSVLIDGDLFRVLPR